MPWNYSEEDHALSTLNSIWKFSKQTIDKNLREINFISKKWHFFLTSFISCHGGITNKLLFDICFGNCNHFPIWQETSLPLKKIFFSLGVFHTLNFPKIKVADTQFHFWKKKKLFSKALLCLFPPLVLPFLWNYFLTKRQSRDIVWTELSGFLHWFDLVY